MMYEYLLQTLYIAQKYTSNICLFQGIIEAATGIGLMVGPAFGSVVYEVHFVKFMLISLNAHVCMYEISCVM